MTENTRTAEVNYTVYTGPSPWALFPSVVGEFVDPLQAPLPSTALAALLPEALFRDLDITASTVSFADASARLAQALLDLAGPSDLKVLQVPASDALTRLVVGFHDPQASILACNTALRIVHAACFTETLDSAAVENALTHAEQVLGARHPDYIARAMLRAARRRSIPAYAVTPGSRVWRFGQGSAGLSFFEAANEHDSMIGARLARDKFQSNLLVTRLGLPGVKHAVTRDKNIARQIAEDLGFPVVVKPVDRGKGLAVTTHIESPDELSRAFDRALEASALGVIVERQVAGDDHRLAVFGGKLQWAVRRMAPRVTGDGRRSVTELIAAENAARGDADVVAGYVTRLVFDEDMRVVLAKQGLTVDDVPQPNRLVRLRHIANTATGGTIDDCSDRVHPDNREMAETIARGFRLDALGIDFMTSDIAKSWREGGCAVIEVNLTPGFSSDGRAEIILAEKFAAGSDGRIPSIVLIDADEALFERIVSSVGEGVARVGCTRAHHTRLNTFARGAYHDPLPVRLASLILDPGCDALVIGVDTSELGAHGFPLDRCDLVLLANTTTLTAALREVVDACALELFDAAEHRDFGNELLPAIRRTIARYQAPSQP